LNDKYRKTKKSLDFDENQANVSIFFVILSEI